MGSPHRPASAWLMQLQRAKVEAAASSSGKPKITIQDVAERANAPNAFDGASAAALVPTSPRSVEACFRLGVDPLELAFRPAASFKRAGEAEALAALRFEHHEKLRQERLQALVEERRRLVDGCAEPVSLSGARSGGGPGAAHGRSGGGGGGGGGTTSSSGGGGSNGGGSGGGAAAEATSAMIEKEKHKLEVLRRRQERDIQQMLQYEVARKQLLDKQQRKIAALEARAAELQRQKAEHEKAWAAAQRERELAKLEEEREHERAAQVAAAERYRRERELQRREAEEARARKRAAYEREVERRDKVEEARRETERILAAQEAEVAARKTQMDARDRERVERMAKEAEERAAANAAKKKKAEERIAAALDTNAAILAKKRHDFEAREAASAARRAELDEAHRRTEALKRQAEAAQEADRRAKYALALAREEERKMGIQARAGRKGEMLALVNAERHAANERRRIERELFDSLRRDKVDSIQKMQAYARQLLLERIMDENERTAALLEQREAIQEQRRAANMAASLHRHKVNQLMESMKNVHNIEKLAPGGTVDVAALTAQLGGL